MTAITVDRFDLQLLAELQRDGHATNSVLGEQIHLSASQVSRRILRLQEAKVIDHYCAVIDPVAVGLDVMAFTEVTLDRQSSMSSDKFEREIEKLPQVLECYAVAGQADFLLRIVVPDLAALSAFMTTHLLRMPGVANVKSTVTLRKIKQTHVLPLEHVMQPMESKKRIYFAQ
jgi:Lrp/AsnC family leucine-responsive transcriptional regulator